MGADASIIYSESIIIGFAPQKQNITIQHLTQHRERSHEKEKKVEKLKAREKEKEKEKKKKNTESDHRERANLAKKTHTLLKSLVQVKQTRTFIFIHRFFLLCDFN